MASQEPNVPDNAVPFWGLMTFTFCLLLAPQNVFPALAPLRIAMIAAAAAIITYSCDRFVHRQPIMMWTREMWIITCLAGWSILMVPLSYWPGGSFALLFDQYFKTLAIFWLLSHTVTTITRLRQVAWGLCLMSVPLDVSGVNNYLSGVFVADDTVKRIVGYDGALTKNPNDLALMINLILPLGVALFLVSRKPLAQSVLAVTIGMGVITVILTYSRAGFLTLATVFLMYLWTFRTRLPLVWTFVAVCLALLSIPFLPSGYLDRLGTITEIESDPTGSSQARWRDTVTAVGLVLRDPIVGAGAGMSTLALNEERGPYWLPVHNVYLEYAVDLGIPGLVLFLLLLVGCIKAARSVQHRSVDVPALRELFYLARGIEISLIAFAVAALFYPVAYHFYFYYMGGLAIAVRATYEAETRNSARDQNRASADELGIADTFQFEKSWNR